MPFMWAPGSYELVRPRLTGDMHDLLYMHMFIYYIYIYLSLYIFHVLYLFSIYIYIYIYIYTHTTLRHDSTTVQINFLKLVLKDRFRPHPCNPMHDSMHASIPDMPLAALRPGDHGRALE